MKKTVETLGRAPQGACELKSHSTTIVAVLLCRAPQGACELKYRNCRDWTRHTSRAPQGACELKSCISDNYHALSTVAPRKGRVS